MYYFSSSYECDTSKKFTIKYHTNNLFKTFGKPDLQKYGLKSTDLKTARLCPVRGRGDITLFYFQLHYYFF